MSLSPLPAWVCAENIAQASLDAPLTAAATRAIAKYGRDKCIKAFELHHIDGEGGSTVGFYLGLKTRQADAAINAGQEIFRKAWTGEVHMLTCSCTLDRYIRANRGLVA